MAARRRTGWRNRGIANRLNISGHNIPVRVKRPTLSITREEGTNVMLAHESGGTDRLIVDARAGEEPEPARVQGQGISRRDLAYWERVLPENREKERDYWEALKKAGKPIDEEKYWNTVPWEEKWDDPNYTMFESGGLEAEYKGGRAGAERAQKAAQASKERLAALEKAHKEAEAEIRKPWHERERNRGAANLLFWRPFNLALDIAALPFVAGSWVISRPARVLGWFNDRILRTPSYVARKEEPGAKATLIKTFGRTPKITDENKAVLRTRLPGGQWRGDFMPSLRTERRAYKKARRAYETQKAKK